MDTTNVIYNYAELADQQLEALDLPAAPGSLYEPVRYTLSIGGKRLRFLFTVAGCGLCGGLPEEAIPAATAMELLHNFTLLHDDVMDAADIRRGKPSVHRKWGMSEAILAGDVLFVKASNQLRYYGSSDLYSKEQYNKIFTIFLESAENVCQGQAFDLEYERDSDITVQDYIKMVEGKTAALISGAFQIGGVVADADEEMLDELKKIGRDIGIAFQIQDDLLDVVGDPGKFGKRRGGDINEGKITYLTVQSLERADKQQKHMLTSILAGKKADAGQIDSVMELYQDLNVIQDARHAVEEYYNDALERLDHFPPSVHRDDIEKLIDKLINREF